MASSNDPLARLFTEGDERLADLIHFLDDPLPEVRASAQKALRYLANPEGMAAVRARLEKAPNESLAAPVPVPLRPADYARIDGEIVGKPLRAPGWGTAVPYLYALALDDAPEAARILDTIAQTGDGNAVSGSTFTAKALCAARLLRPGELVAEKDERLEDLVARHAFFLQPCPPGGAGAPGFRAYARLVAMTADGRRALLVVGWQAAPLAGEWYHVVVRKTERGWRFVSVTLAAVS